MQRTESRTYSHTALETVMNSRADGALSFRDHPNETFFSSQYFVETWSRSFGDQHRPLAIPVESSGPLRTMYGIQKLGSYGLCFVSLAPNGLYASPGWEGQLELSTLAKILHRLMGLRTRGFEWNVRFDHGPLAAGLASLGLKFQRISTHVLHLERDYEHVFAAYNATMRNQVRKAHRQGVVVRDAYSQEDVRAYYEVHTRLAHEKGGYGSLYPMDLFLELVKVRGAVRLLIAECEERVVAGGLFFRDGCSIMYWHGASDRNYSHLFPACAVIDKAIRWACESDTSFFNFGNSGGIASIERFKSFWGTRLEFNWMFEWMNPFWLRLSRLQRFMARSLNGA